MGVKQEKIYEENEILFEIYRMRGLTVSQLCEVIFHSRHYAYKYLQRMKDEGLLIDRMDMNGKLRLAKVYSCTDKAIEQLEKNGYIEKGVKAKDNTPPNNKMKYTILTNEVYAALMPYGINMLDSREWKRKNDMDRNALVRGGLQMLDGREIGLYLFFSPENIGGANLSDSMLKRFKHELKKFPQTNRFTVICYDSKIYEKIVKAVDSDSGMSAFKELLIIPFGKNDFGYNLLRLSRSEIERKADLETILNARLNSNHPSLQGHYQNFASYVAEYKDEERYVVDFLSMNRPVLHHLLTHYHSNAYEKDGRKVDLVCWKANEMELLQKYKSYPHIRIVPVSLKEITETYLPKLNPQKLAQK